MTNTQLLHDFEVPDGLEKRLDQFKGAYRAQNFGIATECFEAALAEHPGQAYAYFATAISNALITSAHRAQRIPHIVETLNRLFVSHPYMHLMYWGEHSIAEHFIRQREENIARGLPSVFLVTQAKSGSVSLANLFTSGFNLPSFAYSFVTKGIVENWIQDYLRGGACYVTHLLPSKDNVDALVQAGVKKMIVHVRDPRQSLVSMFHHVTRYKDIMAEVAHIGFEEKSHEERYRSLLGTYCKHVGWIEGWVEASKHIDILFSTFEEFVTDRDSLIEKYLTFYGGDRRYFDAANALEQHAGTDYHFRKGAIDEWKEVVPKPIADRMSLLLTDELRARFGWKN